MRVAACSKAIAQTVYVIQVQSIHLAIESSLVAPVGLFADKG